MARFDENCRGCRKNRGHPEIMPTLSNVMATKKARTLSAPQSQSFITASSLVESFQASSIGSCQRSRARICCGVKATGIDRSERYHVLCYALAMCHISKLYRDGQSYEATVTGFWSHPSTPRCPAALVATNHPRDYISSHRPQASHQQSPFHLPSHSHQHASYPRPRQEQYH